MVSFGYDFSVAITFITYGTMKKISLYLGLLLLTRVASLHASGESFLFGQGESAQIFVNNRILAVANGKPISVYDIMKKWMCFFYKQYPQYTSNQNARLQFIK